MSLKNCNDLTKKIVLKEGVIKSSLYNSAIKQKINPNVIIEFADFMVSKLIFKEILEKMILIKLFMRHLLMKIMKFSVQEK